MQELVRVNSYVQIKLIFEKQEYIISSKPFEGNNPEWSCDRPIFLPQLLNGKLSNYEIFNSANQIVVSLFDKKVIQKQSRTNKKKFNRTEHSFFLGNIQIPLFTLFQNQKLTATFRLNRPIIIIGYYTDLTNVLGINMNFFNMNGNQKNQKTRVDPQTPTTISLSINVSPVIEIQQENDDIFYGDGIDNRIEYYALKWMETFKKNKVFSQRHIRVWGNDIEQNSFYLPRYLTMLRPPPIFSKGDFIDPKEIKKDIHAIEKVARFVSLIPFKNDTELFKDIPDIHCDSQQFLDLKGGDFEEHAFLLCNYFNYIDFQCGRNYKSYVILGHAIPEGKTFYVLRRDIASNKVEVWNPSTGEPFVMTSEILGTKFLCCTIGKNKQSVIHRYDKACPLYSIGCLVDNKNIYVNIQPSDAPSQIDWNIENPKLWSPFMNDAQIDTLFGEVGIESIYKTEDALKYEVTPLDPIKQLKMTIFSFLERRIVESRQKEVNFQPESTKFRSDGSKDELFQALESMKYKCRLSGLGTELSEENANPAANNSQLNQQAGMNQGNMGGFNQNNPMNMGGFPGNNPSMGGFGGNMPNSDQNEFQQNYNDAIKTLDLIQTKIEEYMPPNKKFFGFPLNMPFTTIEKVWDEIKQTSIHEILQTDIEYVLDVHCYPYPNFIVSVWVFIGVFYDL